MPSPPQRLEHGARAVLPPPSRSGEAADDDVAPILALAYRLFEDPADLVHALLEALVAHLHLPAATVHLHHEARRICVRGSARSDADRDTWPRGNWCVPLAHHDLVFGELSLDAHPASPRECRIIHTFARATTLLLQRYTVRAAARARLDCDLWLVGVSPSVRLLEDRLTEMAGLPMPLLIHGDLGCEARTAAFTVHTAHRPTEPFVEVRCGEVADTTLSTALHHLEYTAPGGTLFLSDVDELDPTCQRLLAERLGRRPSSQLPLLFDAPATSSPGIRVIASTTRPLSDLAAHGAFSKSLWAALDYLRVRIPPLRERRDDIPFFVDAFARLYGRGRVTVSDDAMRLLCAWHWSGNLIELERTLARLIAMARSPLVDVEQLREWAAELVPDRAPLVVVADDTDAAVPTLDVSRDTSPDTEIGAEPTPTFSVLALACELLAQRYDDLDRLHPGLQRALRYIADHFHEEIALERLARESFVSASYLCALFKKSLGMGFKRFQGLLRVERAKTLLVRDRHQRITDISLEVGFGDFSHFLRTFKRATHISPREFRKRHARTIAASSTTPVAS